MYSFIAHIIRHSFFQLAIDITVSSFGVFSIELIPVILNCICTFVVGLFECIVCRVFVMYHLSALNT